MTTGGLAEPRKVHPIENRTQRLHIAPATEEKLSKPKLDGPAEGKDADVSKVAAKLLQPLVREAPDSPDSCRARDESFDAVLCIEVCDGS